MYYPSSPLRAIQELAPTCTGAIRERHRSRGSGAARGGSDVALVFVTQWNGEALDKPLTLPDEQDALVAAVASANPRTVVVLETGGAGLHAVDRPGASRPAGMVSGHQRG